MRCCWTGCEELARGDAPPLCDGHVRRTALAWMASQANEPHLTKRAKFMASQSQVYYVRIGDHIKIGYSINMRQRIGALRIADEAVLATEPGGRELEAVRHQEFAAERIGRREDFNPSRRLLAWVEQVQLINGPPRITTYPKAGDLKSA